MYRIFLSIKYLSSRIIPFLAMFAVALGVMSMIVVISVMNGFIVQTRVIARGTLADLTVTPLVTNASQHYLDLIRTAPKVKAVSPHLVRQALVSTGFSGHAATTHKQLRELSFVTVLGIDPALERLASDFERYLANFEEVRDEIGDPRPWQVDDVKEPFSLETEDRRRAAYPKVVVGLELAKRLGIRKGTFVDLMTYAINDEPGVPLEDKFSVLHEKFVCAGVFRSGSFEIDLGFLYMPLEQLRSFSNAPKDDISEFAVTLEDYLFSDQAKEELQELFMTSQGATAIVETWEDKESIFLSAVDNEKRIMAVILFFFLLFACFAIFIILNMMVREKTRDIGILNSLGATFGGILQIFVMNALIISIVGATIGLVGGVLICENVNAIEQFLKNAFGLVIFKPDVYAFDRLPVDMRTDEVVTIIVLTIGLSAISGLFPAFRAARLDPVEALRYE